jgi:hypothetical protein
MELRSAHLLSLGVALPLFIASLPAEAAENDDVMKVVDDLCVNHRGNLKDGAAKAMKLPYAPRDGGEDRGPPPRLRAVWLEKLGSGTILTFSAKSLSAPVSECKLVSHVRDLADLVGRLKTAFDLGEPKTSEFSVQLTMKGQKDLGGKQHTVELVYGFEENKPSGAFNLTVNR